MNLYAIVLAVIVLTLLIVSVARLGKVKTKADYLVAGRSLPAFVLVFTLLSSWIGSGSLLGGAENAYKHGFVALWQGAGGWAGLLLIYFIAPRARQLATITLLIALPVLTHQAGGWTNVRASLPATHFQFFGDLSVLQAIELFL